VRLGKPGGTVWVHDYQLMLVPRLIRRAGQDNKIGFFLHIPFPGARDFAKLKESKILLRGILGADLAGFHTRGYTQNFLDACDTQLSIISQGGRLLMGERTVHATEFPMGIDHARFEAATRQPSNRLKARLLRRKYPGQKIIVSVDRLDLTKGLEERLKAYRTLLHDHPELHGKVTMVMIVAPSRTDIPEYKRLKENLDKILADIQKRYGRPDWQPVDFRYETVPLDEVMTYYQMADIAFITPLRDGMNLVAKEFIASKRNNDGVLVLSQTAGAAEELRDAVLVDPRKPKTMVAGLQQALNMPSRELHRRARHMNEQIKEFSVQHWAENFMETLQKPRSVRLSNVLPIDERMRRRIASAYRKSERRLVLLDYDGVLRGFTHNPEDAKPSSEVMKLLDKLTRDAKNDVMIVSGRSRKDLAEWFGHLDITLAAEHGATIRRKGGKNWHRTTSSDRAAWQPVVAELFKYYADLTPGAFTEQKEWAVAWHYRAASPYYSQKHLVALRRLLKPLAREFSLQVIEGHKVLEVRPRDVNKRRAAQEWIIHDHDFILAIGDDVTDEDMFAALPTTAYSIKVGHGQTAANYRVSNVRDVLKLLSSL
jgi:trehalose 6-phosphate synthase/phosphatase